MDVVESRQTADTRPRKGALSCAECRRSKLKCDRVFPCQSCVRRGCAHLCPHGMLAATKGNKVIMARAQKLAEKVKSMSTRIQDLESALQQSSVAIGGTANLLTSRADDDHASESTVQDVSDGIDALSIDAEGRHGRFQGSEYFFDLISPAEGGFPHNHDLRLSNLPPEVTELMNAFPFGLRDCPHTMHIFMPFLPSRARTLQLVDLYYKNVAWMYNPLVLDDFMKTIMEPIYGMKGLINLQDLHPHRLSVFFILVATGILYDDDCPSASALAEQYYALSRAAFALNSILVGATYTAIQAVFMMVRYIYSPDQSSNETRWLLTGLCCRLAQMIGLERDCAGWNLEPEEIQCRRNVFWEIYTYDAWTALVNGRPPALQIQYTDCRFPDDLDGDMMPSGDIEWGWHAWKFRYSATCLSTSVQHAFMTKIPHYSALLELDKKIRNFPVSHHLQIPETNLAWSGDPSRAMQQYGVICHRDFNLLFLHRSYFAQAIREQSKNPLQHKFAPSVRATYSSACRLISALKGLYAKYPTQTSRVWFFWTAIFSSCIVLGALVAESPNCALSRDALQELESAVSFYEEGSRSCRPPTHIVSLQKLYRRAYSAYRDFHTSTPSAEHSPHTQHDSLDVSDECEVLDTRKNVVSNRSSPYPTRSSSGSSQTIHRQVQVSTQESLTRGQPDQGFDLNWLDPRHKGLLDISYQESVAGVFARHQAAEIPVHGYDSQLFVESQAYDDLRSLEYLPVPSQHEVIPHHHSSPVPGQPITLPQEGSPYAALFMHPQPDTQTFSEDPTFGGDQVTQEEIWRDFIRRLGFMGACP